jgi:SAM-dependent methyltransferase
MISTADPETSDHDPQIAIISWREPAADYSSEFRFSECHFRRSLSAYPTVLSGVPAEAGVNQVRASQPSLAKASRWFVIRSPMALLRASVVEDLTQILDNHSDLACIAASEIGVDQPEGVAGYPYYTWRGFIGFQDALKLRPPQLAPLAGRNPFAFMLDHGRVPHSLGSDPITHLPRALPAGLAAVAANVFVHPLSDYYRYPRMDIVDLLPEGITSLLDVGCGSGAFGEVVRERSGCRVVGVELNPAAAAAASQVLDDVIEGDIKDLTLDERFDVITVNDVLEHVEDPELMLGNLLGVVDQGGQLILSIPNVGHWSIVEDLMAGHWDYLPAGLLCIDHLRFFTLNSVTSMMSRAGWKPIRIEAIPGPLPDDRRELYQSIGAPGSPVDLDSLEAQGYIIVAKRSGDTKTGG